ncbi:MAG: alanine--tRNA ligase [Steroidobacteraceae bacterium]
MTVKTPPKMSAADVRRAFLEFFRDRGHEVVPSSSLVPGNDPTLLFTNAGMVQFKDLFLGKEQRSYRRAASSQRCVRAGGKHNDLENVGYTARHHTFFEMLGNFSFGDYFKREAIEYAWGFVTEVLKLDPARLWVTVFEEDDEAADLWLNHIGVDDARFTRLGEKSNFWAMGDTGPCGPCSEIFYDHGPDIPGGPPGSPDEDGDRYVEIWNLVFMQFDRSSDGQLTPLPRPSVDTGAGLERLAAVMQGVHNNYDIDLFRNLIEAAAKLAGTTDRSHNSLRVIADHIRATSFLMVDGVMPANEGRGYVLRRIMRRAIRHGYKLGIREPFFHRLVAPLAREMSGAYPELARAQSRVSEWILLEEQRFAETLANGMSLLEGAIASLGERREIDGATVFRLYDTFGFPVDLTADIARERGLAIDQAGFDAAMQEQRDRARAASRFAVDQQAVPQTDVASEFTGYATVAGEARVAAIFVDGKPVSAVVAPQKAEVILDRTPFYAESGGQVGDRGVLMAGDSRFVVDDTQKRGRAHSHIGELAAGRLAVGERVSAEVAADQREATVLNHSATHLLHAALRQVLGTHVEQKGSLVEAARLRFDFSHFKPLTDDELNAVERLVNRQIRDNAAATAEVMAYDDAIAGGAMALFGEKYDSRVRVLRIGEFSTELCGGTHVARAGDIGLFKITGESGVAAGVRRIEAVTGEAAWQYVAHSESLLNTAASQLRTTRDELTSRVQDTLERVKQLERELRAARDKLASGAGQDLAAAAVQVGPARLLAKVIDDADAAALRNAVDGLKSRLGTAVIVLASVQAADRLTIVAGVTDDLTGRIRAGDVANHVARQVGGRGGGRADFAQAGGKDAAALPGALAGVRDFVAAGLGLA